MPALLDQVIGLATRPFLRAAVVAEATDLTPRFRRIDLTTSRARWAVGDKVQVHAGRVNFRTFTPFAWDDERVSLLAYRHGTSTVSRWMDGLASGATVPLFGPRGSLGLSTLTSGPIMVGDETSFALAAAWQHHGVASPVASIYETTDAAESDSVLRQLGLGPHLLVERTDNDGHHVALNDAVVAAASDHPEAWLVLTGKAQSIRAVRGAIKGAGLAPTARVKAYWDPNRSALD